MPLAVSIALLRAARAGIFIKNPDALERLRKVDTVLLDKTGTLTEGRSTVARWQGDDARAPVRAGPRVGVVARRGPRVPQRARAVDSGS